MLYSKEDLEKIKRQVLRRVLCMALLCLIPNLAALFVMNTVRLQALSDALSLLGVAAAIFYWGLCISPLVAYARYLREVLTGRNHEFTGKLKEVDQDSVREGVACKTLVFADEAGDEERLCYFDLEKLPKDFPQVGERYRVTVHGQSILEMKIA